MEPHFVFQYEDKMFTFSEKNVVTPRIVFDELT